MKKLEDALAGNETVKQTSNYINEDTAQKGNYDHYVNQAKQIVDQQDNLICLQKILTKLLKTRRC